jgi:hypothetical protein
MTTSTDLGRARAWAWVAHLRAGGTTPWAAWSPPDRPVGPGGDRFLPGAQQLELLRRLNLAGSPPGGLVERVLAASAPGRGRPDLELVGVDAERRFGPPAVDPGGLPDDELLRVATALLAEDLVAAGAAPPAGRRTRRLRVRYELAGDPWLAGALTARLVADGRPPGGGGRAVHVLGTDLATMLAHTWAAGSFGAGGPTWPDFLARARARRRVPRRVDLVGVVERYLARPHTGRVGVVLDLEALPRLVGVRHLGAVPDVSVPAAELARQVAAALSLLVLPDRQTELLRTFLRPRLAEAAEPLPGVPLEHRDWVEDAAARLRSRLLRAGYPVVGDPDRLLPRWSESPDDRPVLELALELLLRPVTGEEVP